MPSLPYCFSLIVAATLASALDAHAGDGKGSWSLQAHGTTPDRTDGTKKKLSGSWKPNQHASHTFFAPSAIPLEQGEGYYQNNYVIQHSAWFAPERHFSIGAGFQMLSLITSISSEGKLPAYFLAMKAGAKLNPDLHVGVYGVIQQFSSNPPFNDSLATDYKVATVCAQVTYGSLNRHITISGGLGHTAAGWTHDPVIGISGEWRVIERMSIITENWLLKFGSEPYSIYTVGVRFLHRKLAADGGLVYNQKLAEDFSPVVPYIGFALRF